jgi:hypothetical protein
MSLLRLIFESRFVFMNNSFSNRVEHIRANFEFARKQPCLLTPLGIGVLLDKGLAI